MSFRIEVSEKSSLLPTKEELSILDGFIKRSINGSKYPFEYQDWEDFGQKCKIKFIRAYDNFITSGIPVRPYLRRLVKNNYFNLVRNTYFTASRPPPYNFVQIDPVVQYEIEEGGWKYIRDSIGSTLHNQEKEEELITKLDSIQKEILILRMDGLNFTEISKLKKIHYQKVIKINNQIRSIYKETFLK